MINFIDEKGVKHSAIVECKKTKGVNGEKSLSGTIYTNGEILEGIGRGWRLEFENEKYCLTYVYPIDEGNRIVVEFDAVHEFFFDLNKKVVYSELNGSNTAKAYLDLIFNGSGYSYVIEVNIQAFEKEGFGMRNRLDLFKDFISSTGVEFSVNGKIVRILEKVGSNLSTIVKKGFNLNELRIEKDPGAFITYKKGFGAWVDDEDHTKGRLAAEYLSPLASIYGKLEGDPVVDERYKVATNLETRLQKEVEASYGLSVDIDMEDLTKAGYNYEQPHEGDYIMAINKDLGFAQKIRIMSYETSYDTNGHIIDHQVFCGSDNIIQKSIKEDEDFRKEIRAGLEGAISTSNKAWISANGKNTVFEGPDEPTATAIGDIWFQVDGEEKIMRIWNGYEWKPFINPAELNQKIEQAEQDILDTMDTAQEGLDKANQALQDSGLLADQLPTIEGLAASAQADALQAIEDAQNLLTKYKSLEGRNLILGTAKSYTFDNNTGNNLGYDDTYAYPDYHFAKGENQVEWLINNGLNADDAITISGTVKFIKHDGTSLKRNDFPDGFKMALLRFVGSGSSWQHSNSLEKSQLIDNVSTYHLSTQMLINPLDITIPGEVIPHWWHRYFPAGYSIEFTELMINKGDKTLGWQPAPEDVQIEFSNLSGELTTKVSQTTFDTLAGTVSTQGTAIMQNANDITQRATKTEVNTLSGTVTSLSSTLTTETGKISALNTKTDGHTTQIGNLQTSYDSLNSTVAQVQTDLAGKVSTTAFSDYQQTVNGFMQTVQNDKADKTMVNALAGQWQTTTQLVEGHTSQISSLGNQINLRIDHLNTMPINLWDESQCTLYSSLWGNGGEYYDIKGDNQATATSISITSGFDPWTQYTVQFNGVVGAHFNKACFKYTDGTYSEKAFANDQVDSFTSTDGKTVSYFTVDTGGIDSVGYIRRGTFKLEKGDRATAYVPHTNAYAQRKKLITQINLSDEGILIQGKKIMVDGETYISDGVIKTAHIGDLSVTGAKIADASISNAKIVSLDASKISVGTLTGFTLNAANINGGEIRGNSLIYLNNGSDNVVLTALNGFSTTRTVAANGVIRSGDWIYAGTNSDGTWKAGFGFQGERVRANYIDPIYNNGMINVGQLSTTAAKVQVHLDAVFKRAVAVETALRLANQPSQPATTGMMSIWCGDSYAGYGIYATSPNGTTKSLAIWT